MEGLLARGACALAEASNLVGFGFLGPGLARIQLFATNRYELTLHVKFKEHSCKTLTLTIYYTIVRPMVGHNKII